MAENRERCRFPGCERSLKGDGGFTGRFCSTGHEVKYEHLRADAREARRDAERAAREDERL